MCRELVHREPAVARLAVVADGLEPADDLLDALADALADLVPGVARRPLVDLGPAILGVLLRDVRRNVACAKLGDEVGRVVGLVCTNGEALPRMPAW